MNAVFTITPRRMKKSPLWVFDDPQRGLMSEPFLEDASEVLSDIARKVNAKDEMVLVFSQTEMPNQTAMATRAGSGKMADQAGCFYNLDGKRFWLCPAVTKYFPNPPETIFVKAFPVEEEL